MLLNLANSQQGVAGPSFTAMMAADSGALQQAKLVLLGDMGAGKSSLVLRFVKGQFFDYQARPASLADATACTCPLGSPEPLLCGPSAACWSARTRTCAVADVETCLPPSFLT